MSEHDVLENYGVAYKLLTQNNIVRCVMISDTEPSGATSTHLLLVMK